ncbi:MAG: SWIM zinc finger family protein [Myxococcales bacterium]|nr:SWIM zinc finger family protein [Myxococcales bacterium]
MSWRRWPKQERVGEREHRAVAKLRKLEKKGEALRPIVIEGRGIAQTFWGRAWCQNLERYSDFSNRLPRGRSYVRHRAVLDLKIAAGEVTALTQGSRLYRQTIAVKELPPWRWRDFVGQCVGEFGSMLELLRGRLSREVMLRVTDPESGLFPSPGELSLSCSCPDWAQMCKHVAAVLYGVGARLDEEPELLFLLRGVDATELVSSATVHALDADDEAGESALEGDLGDIFGIELDSFDEVPAPAQVAKPPRRKATKRKAASTATKKTATKKTPTKKAKKAATKKTATKKTPTKKATKKTPTKKTPTRRTATTPQHARKRSAPRGEQTVLRGELLDRGVPSSTIQSWLRNDVLTRTVTPGVYRLTRVARERLDGYSA